MELINLAFAGKSAIFSMSITSNFRKPLIVFSPKSLLRDPRCVSTVAELANGTFQETIDDTTVNKADIKSYYKEYITNFILHKDIIKARLIVLDKDALIKVKIESLISAQANKNLNELTDICEMYAVNYFLNDSAWVYCSDFSYKLPFSERESNKILSRTNKTHTFIDDNFVYILFVKDYQIKGSNSPLPFVFNNIRSLLQNKNKIKFINDIEDKLYQKSISSGDIKIY